MKLFMFLSGFWIPHNNIDISQEKDSILDGILFVLFLTIALIIVCGFFGITAWLFNYLDIIWGG